MTLNMYIATSAWLLLVLGVLNCRNRRKHVPLVGLALALDLGLVLYLQLTRNAVQTAVGETLSVLERVHVGLSTLAVLLYIPTILLGIKLLRGDERVRYWHRRIALSALCCRTGGFFFMFSMWKS